MPEEAGKESIPRSADAVLPEVSLFRALAEIEATEDAVHAAQAYQGLVRRLYFERRDLPAMLMAATAGVRFCLAEAKRLTGHDADRALALRTSAKVIAYNAGANAWPGWKDEGVTPSQGEILAGLELARLSLELVEELDLGASQRGNGQWLVGAHLLALRRWAEAEERFGWAATGFVQSEEVAAQLMAEAYAALAGHLAAPGDPAPLSQWEEKRRALASDGSEDAAAYLAQLETARAVFQGGA